MNYPPRVHDLRDNAEARIKELKLPLPDHYAVMRVLNASIFSASIATDERENVRCATH